jgi:hypothetical protein
MNTGCVRIRNATRLTLKLTERMAGHAVRIVATAKFDGRKATSLSKRIAIRGRGPVSA